MSFHFLVEAETREMIRAEALGMLLMLLCVLAAVIPSLLRTIRDQRALSAVFRYSYPQTNRDLVEPTPRPLW